MSKAIYALFLTNICFFIIPLVDYNDCNQSLSTFHYLIMYFGIVLNYIVLYYIALHYQSWINYPTFDRYCKGLMKIFTPRSQ